jgi:hypothetical protein
VVFPSKSGSSTSSIARSTISRATAAEVYAALDHFFLLSGNMERPTLESMMIGKPTSPATPGARATAAEIYAALDHFFLLFGNMECPTLESLMIDKPTPLPPLAPGRQPLRSTWRSTASSSSVATWSARQWNP